MQRDGRAPLGVSRWCLAGVFIVALAAAVAWAISNPPGAAPDEPSHYVRVEGLARGDLRGDPLPEAYLLNHGFVPGVKLQHVQQGAGVYVLPGALQPPDFCNRFHPSRPFDCVLPTPSTGAVTAVSLHAGTLPLSYLLPAAFARFGTTTHTALALGRLGFAVQGALLVLAIALAIRRLSGDRRRTAVMLVALSATPLLWFEIGTLSPNGTETLAVVAFAAWLLVALHHRDGRALRPAVAIGVAACFTRDVSWLLVLVATLIVFVAVERPRDAWNTFPSRRRRGCTAALAFGVAASALWSHQSSGPLGHIDTSWSSLVREVRRLWTVLLHSVSLVGSLDVKLDDWTAVLWWILFAVAVFTVASGRRWWRTVSVGAASWAVLTMVLSLTSQSFGYGVQARYTLFVPGIVAMCAFVQPRREVPVIVERVAVVVVALFVGAMHFATMLINGERHAVGLTSRPLSFSHSVWSPPTGWPAALTLCAVASAGVTACVAVAGWSGERPSAESVGE